MPTKKETGPQPEPALLVVERVQTGIRIEKRMLKVLKGVAEYLDISLGDLLEGIVLHSFDNKLPFSKEVLERIAQLKDVYGLDYGSEMSHRLTESSETETRRPVKHR
jgi:hypothetical protein